MTFDPKKRIATKATRCCCRGFGWKLSKPLNMCQPYYTLALDSSIIPLASFVVMLLHPLAATYNHLPILH